MNDSRQTFGLGKDFKMFTDGAPQSDLERRFSAAVRFDARLPGF
jgi:hypothetical protein